MFTGFIRIFFGAFLLAAFCFVMLFTIALIIHDPLWGGFAVLIFIALVIMSIRRHNQKNREERQWMP